MNKDLAEILAKLTAVRNKSMDYGLQCAVVYLLTKYADGELDLDIKKWKQEMGNENAILNVTVDRRKGILKLRVVPQGSTEYKEAMRATEEKTEPFIAVPQGERVN